MTESVEALKSDVTPAGFSGAQHSLVRGKHRNAGFDLPRKPRYHGGFPPALGTNMSTLLVSSKGQIVLPAALRRRLGMGAGARIEVLEESDGLKLRVIRSVATADLTGMAGMVKAPVRGAPRRLGDFDPASLLTRSRRGKP